MMNLNSLLDVIITKQTVTPEMVFDLVFQNGTTSPSEFNSEILQQNIKKLSNCFDLNGDGTFTVDDLDYLKSMDMVTILKIVNASTYIVQLIKELKSVKMDVKTTIDLTYKVIVYATLLPLAINSGSFRSWALRNNNKALLIQSLETIYNIVSTSDDAAKAVSDIVKMFKSKGFCSCMSAPADKTAVVTDIQTKVSTEISQVLHTNQTHVTKKRICELEAQLASLRSALEPVATTNVNSDA